MARVCCVGMQKDACELSHFKYYFPLFVYNISSPYCWLPRKKEKKQVESYFPVSVRFYHLFSRFASILLASFVLCSSFSGWRILPPPSAGQNMHAHKCAGWHWHTNAKKKYWVREGMREKIAYSAEETFVISLFAWRKWLSFSTNFSFSILCFFARLFLRIKKMFILFCCIHFASVESRDGAKPNKLALAHNQKKNKREKKKTGKCWKKHANTLYSCIGIYKYTQ